MYGLSSGLDLEASRSGEEPIITVVKDTSWVPRRPSLPQARHREATFYYTARWRHSPAEAKR